MTNNEYNVASASKLRGSKLWNGTDDIPGVDVMDYGTHAPVGQLKRRSAFRKSVRFTPSTIHKDHVPIDIQDEGHNALKTAGQPSSIPGASPSMQPETPQLLLPTRYSPPVSSRVAKANDELPQDDSDATVKEVEVPLHKLKHERRSILADHLATEADASHKRNLSNTSTSSRRGRQKLGDEIYFTPVDLHFTKSQIFLSSPVGSPTLPDLHNTVGTDQEDDDDDQVSTPRASLSRPPSEIYVGPLDLGPAPKQPKKSEKLSIKPAQLDQIVTALAKSRMVQKDVRKHWWDDEDVSDDESSPTLSTISTMPTLTSASTIYSQPNDMFLNNGLSLDVRKETLAEQKLHDTRAHFNVKRLPATPNIPFGGVALADPQIHGSPIRYITQNYRVGGQILPVGACSFVTVPYDGRDSNIRIEPPSASNPTSRILLQCINQAVDRKSGGKTNLVLAEIDVTDHFTKAALAEIAEVASTTTSEIEIAPSPVLPTLKDDQIDWAALADELQSSSLIADLIESTLTHISQLTREACSMPTLTLLSKLSEIKDQHQDFLILKPTAFHANGVASNMRLPWLSQRLWHDWYSTEEKVGTSDKAEGFRMRIISEVAKGAVEGKTFHTTVGWGKSGGEKLLLKCVPLREKLGSGKGDIWVCFVRGMVEEGNFLV